MTHQPAAASAVDSQLVEQLKWTTETICGVFKVPAALIDSSHAAPYGNSEQLVQQFYSQCLQALMTAIELSLDEGLDLMPLGTEFNIDDLYWMDTATRTKAAGDAIGSAVLTVNESRRKYFGYGPIAGGDYGVHAAAEFQPGGAGGPRRDSVRWPRLRPRAVPAAQPPAPADGRWPRDGRSSRCNRRRTSCRSRTAIRTRSCRASSTRPQALVLNYCDKAPPRRRGPASTVPLEVRSAILDVADRPVHDRGDIGPRRRVGRRRRGTGSRRRRSAAS